RRARAEEGPSRGPRHHAHRHAHVRGAADRRDHPRGRAHVLPRAPPRPGRPGPDHPALLMRRDLTSSVIAIVVITVLCGLAYPLFVTGVSQVAFPGNSNGQKITVDGRLAGSKLIGQDFGGNPRYFQPRPSTLTKYNAAASAFTNLGPNSKDARDTFK